MGCCTSGYRSTAYDHIQYSDLSSKTFIVTGGTAGLGLETARALIKANARVIITGRDEKKLEQVGEQLHCSAMLCDLSSFESIRQFVLKFKNLKYPLHALICNAGVNLWKFQKTKDGLGATMGTNHFGHFLLTMLLTDVLIASAPSRVVVVSSALHAGSPIDFSEIRGDDESRYSMGKSYQQSKLANVMFALEYNRRYRAKGVTAYSLHPGVIATDLANSVACYNKNCIGACFGCCLKTPAQGAATSVYCAVVPNLEKFGGGYFQNSALSVADSYANDTEVATRLWDVSNQIVGLTERKE